MILEQVTVVNAQPIEVRWSALQTASYGDRVVLIRQGFSAFPKSCEKVAELVSLLLSGKVRPSELPAELL